MTNSSHVNRPSRKTLRSIVFLELYIYLQVRGTARMLGKCFDEDEQKRVEQAVTSIAQRLIDDETLKACGWPHDYILPTTQPTQHNG